MGLTGLGFNIANLCADCIHRQATIEQVLASANPDLEVSCERWLDIVGLVLSAVGLALSVLSGSGWG